ncbi:hypothetical protein NP590_14675 [Methylomonas sp. SURF-2]|uniref:Uncharacterized protein n=1 Tax=Methylomonas subterranea TaxID=2952225 RepID=A0ABT1TIR2_9GAMM|nr:hypothetical protein [Methylomonas sp. SURF-2]MCQ8105357.1 hypothetical protein [Methylomonas sp. SURF-2]
MPEQNSEFSRLLIFNRGRFLGSLRQFDAALGKNNRLAVDAEGVATGCAAGGDFAAFDRKVVVALLGVFGRARMTAKRRHGNYMADKLI